MIIVSSGSGTVTNINTALPLSGGPITTSGTITTSMATNKLIGRSTAGTGAMEEIIVGTGLSLTGGTLSSTGGGAAGSTNEIQFNNAAAFAASGNLRWIIADNRIVLGTENTPDTNSRMVVIGKGISTQNTFAVHNQTGTNNSLIVRDDGRVGIATNAPANLFQVAGTNASSLSGLEVDAAGVVYAGRTNSNSANYINMRVGGENGTFGRGGLAIGATGGLVIYGNTSNSFPNIVIPNANFQLGFSTAYNNTFANNNIRFTLSAAGNSHTSTIECNDNNSASLRLRSLNGRILLGSTDNLILTNVGNLLLGTTSENAGSTKVLVINNGTAPSGNVTASFQQYSDNISGAGTAAPHFRTENGNVIKIYQETTGVASATFVQNSGNRVDEVSTFDGYTIAQVVKALRNQGLLA